MQTILTAVCSSVSPKQDDRARSLDIFKKTKSGGTHCIWGGGMFQRTWAMAEQALFLDPNNWDSLTGSATCLPYLPSWDGLMWWGKDSSGPMLCRTLNVITSTLNWIQKQTGTQCSLCSKGFICTQKGFGHPKLSSWLHFVSAEVYCWLIEIHKSWELAEMKWETNLWTGERQANTLHIL